MVRFGVDSQTDPTAQATRYDAPVAKTSDPPDPATWTMLILGFGGAGVAIRRGRANRLQAAKAGR